MSLTMTGGPRGSSDVPCGTPHDNSLGLSECEDVGFVMGWVSHAVIKKVTPHANS